jgi:ATP-dependent helicase HrpA
MEIRKGGQTLIGFPALIDAATRSRSRSSTSPRWRPRGTAPACAACSRCSSSEPLKYLEKNIPDLQKMAVAYMSWARWKSCAQQIIDVALERAFLLNRCPPMRRFRAASTRVAAG